MHPWKILGISAGASTAEIKKAYKKRAFATHPDQGGDAEDFKSVVWAYKVLEAEGFASGGDSRRAGRSASEQFTNEAALHALHALQYAAAFYDAWLNVPPRLRFVFSAFRVIHSLLFLAAGPLFMGGALLFVSSLSTYRIDAILRGSIFLTFTAPFIYLAGPWFWEKWKFNLREKYARSQADARERSAAVVPLNQSRSQTARADDADQNGEIAGCLVVWMGFVVSGVVGYFCFQHVDKPAPTIADFFQLLFNLSFLPLFYFLFWGVFLTRWTPEATAEFRKQIRNRNFKGVVVSIIRQFVLS